MYGNFARSLRIAFRQSYDFSSLQPHCGRRRRVYPRKVCVANEKPNNSLGSQPSSDWKQLHVHQSCRKRHLLGSLLVWPLAGSLSNTVKLFKCHSEACAAFIYKKFQGLLWFWKHYLASRWKTDPLTFGKCIKYFSISFIDFNINPLNRCLVTKRHNPSAGEKTWI